MSREPATSPSPREKDRSEEPCPCPELEKKPRGPTKDALSQAEQSSRDGSTSSGTR